MTDSVAHADLMDSVYRRQRLIYNLTRKYFLLGRDHLIDELAARPGDTILEIACGTGRNLARVCERYPQARLYGIDLSNEMLKSAHRALRDRAILAQADACTFDGKAVFGVERFDRIIISYSLSMIPDWTSALRVAASHLAPGGSLHLVDFGGQRDLPAWFGHMLRGWLAKFHVSPRADIGDVLRQMSAERGTTAHMTPLYRDYAFYGVLQGPQQGPANTDAY